MTLSHQSLLAVTASALLAAFVSCGGWTVRTVPAATEKLSTARERWQARAAEMSGYDLSLNVSCYCPHSGRYLVKVQFGLPNEVVDLERPRQISEESIAIIRGYDVGGLFRTVQGAIEHHYDRVDVIYDQSYGFPIAIQLDGNATMYDDELQILATIATHGKESK